MSKVLRFSLLGSGSSGNAILVATPGGKVIIDSGISYRQLRLRAQQVNENLADLKAIFVTHEHRDHVAGVGVLARALKVPVYITRQTHDALPVTVGQLPRVEFIEPGETVAVDGMRLTSFSVCHDAADPVSYVIECAGAKLGVASDLGRVSTLVRQRLEKSHALLLESNYCPEMLRTGPYPFVLQQRIRGNFGHLSNSDMNSLLASLLHDALKYVVLVHLSEENNTPEHARGLAARVLNGHPAELHVAPRHQPTPVFEIES